MLLMKPFNYVYSLSQRLGYAHIFWCMGALVIINTFSARLIEGLCDRTEHFDIFLFSAHHSMVFYFRCSVYWWKGSVRF